VRVDGRDADLERRVVHREQGRDRRRQAQRVVEPSQPRRVQLAAPRATSRRVERDEPNRPRLDRVAQRSLWREVAVVGKGVAQLVAIVMVAGDEKERHLQLTEELAQPFVFFRLAPVDQVARRDDQRRPRYRCIEHRDRAPQVATGVNHVVKEVALAADVRVGDLRDEHEWSIPGSSATRVAHKRTLMANTGPRCRFTRLKHHRMEGFPCLDHLSDSS
jgi:hypothetical protein